MPVIRPRNLSQALMRLHYSDPITATGDIVSCIWSDCDGIFHINIIPPFCPWNFHEINDKLREAQNIGTLFFSGQFAFAS